MLTQLQIEKGIVALAKLEGLYQEDIPVSRQMPFNGDCDELPCYNYDDKAMDRVIRNPKLFDAKTLVKYALELSECVGTGLLEMLPCLRATAEQKFEAACRALSIF